MMMAAKLLALSRTLLLISLWGHLVGAQSNGDLRLIERSTHKIDGYGRLEIYLDGEWGTFCVNGFDSFAGDIACRQLGYTDSFEVSKASHDEEIPLASNSTPIHTVFNRCGKSGCNAVLHILRCVNVDFIPDPSCTHDDDVIVMCSIWPLDEDSCYSYDTQLYLNSEALNSIYRSSGVLEIYSSISQGGALSGWSNICGTKFDQNAANSACIQLGYTGALSYTTSANRSRDNDIWLDGVMCGDYIAYSCLDSCFCYPWPLTTVQCDPGNVVAVTCTFDLADKSTTFPGGRDGCEEERKTFCAPESHTENPKNLIIISSVLSAIIMILSLVVVGLMVMMWNRREQAHYQTIN